MQDLGFSNPDLTPQDIAAIQASNEEPMLLAQRFLLLIAEVLSIQAAADPRNAPIQRRPIGNPNPNPNDRLKPASS